MKPREWNRTTVNRPYFSQCVDFLVTRDLKDDRTAHFKAFWVADDPTMIPGSATGHSRTVRIEQLQDGLWYASPFCGPKDRGFENPTKAAEHWLHLYHGSCSCYPGGACGCKL